MSYSKVFQTKFQLITVSSYGLIHPPLCTHITPKVTSLILLYLLIGQQNFNLSGNHHLVTTTACENDIWYSFMQKKITHCLMNIYRDQTVDECTFRQQLKCFSSGDRNDRHCHILVSPAQAFFITSENT